MSKEIAELRRLMKREISDNNHDNARIIGNAIDHIQQLEASLAEAREANRDTANRMRYMAAEFYSEHCENSTPEQIHQGLMNLNLDV